MFILIVDDEQVRHNIAENYLSDIPGCSLLHAFTYEEGKELLEMATRPIALLLLDHDLGSGKNGSDLAGFILNELDIAKFPAQAVSHSWSAPGAANVTSKLRTAGIPTRVWPFDAELCKFMVEQLQPQ
jgi:response regulator of citrate/malate metabolism